MERVLVVDDSSFARMMLKRCLSIAGVGKEELLEAENGQQALDLLREDNTIQLVVSDINMPILDGRAMLRRIRASPRLNHVPVIVVSSLVNDDARAELLQIGASVVLGKPISPKLMIDACATVSAES
ncbi:MAG: response regulator [Myxococcota bacterium]